VQGHPTPWMAFWAAVIVGREIAVSALREWMAEIGQRATVKVAFIGKVKTVVQMLALLMLLYSVVPGRKPEPWPGDIIFHTGDWMLAAAALLTLWSGAQYLIAAWPALMADERKGG
jgi:CDP-diacylglycerol---glycerol-3-phosphate 3-phosphatidyltransferase